MTTGQYRALVAYLNFWTPQYLNMDIHMAVKDLEIAEPIEDVIAELDKAGWVLMADTGTLVWVEDVG